MLICAELPVGSQQQQQQYQSIFQLVTSDELLRLIQQTFGCTISPSERPYWYQINDDSELARRILGSGVALVYVGMWAVELKGTAYAQNSNALSYGSYNSSNISQGFYSQQPTYQQQAYPPQSQAYPPQSQAYPPAQPYAQPYSQPYAQPYTFSNQYQPQQPQSSYPFQNNFAGYTDAMAQNSSTSLFSNPYSFTTTTNNFANPPPAVADIVLSGNPNTITPAVYQQQQQQQTTSPVYGNITNTAVPVPVAAAAPPPVQADIVLSGNPLLINDSSNNNIADTYVPPTIASTFQSTVIPLTTASFTDRSVQRGISDLAIDVADTASISSAETSLVTKDERQIGLVIDPPSIDNDAIIRYISLTFDIQLYSSNGVLTATPEEAAYLASFPKGALRVAQKAFTVTPMSKMKAQITGRHSVKTTKDLSDLLWEIGISQIYPSHEKDPLVFQVESQYVDKIKAEAKKIKSKQVKVVELERIQLVKVENVDASTNITAEHIVEIVLHSDGIKITATKNLGPLTFAASSSDVPTLIANNYMFRHHQIKFVLLGQQQQQQQQPSQPQAPTVVPLTAPSIEQPQNAAAVSSSSSSSSAASPASYMAAAAAAKRPSVVKIYHDAENCVISSTDTGVDAGRLMKIIVSQTLDSLYPPRGSIPWNSVQIDWQFVYSPNHPPRFLPAPHVRSALIDLGVSFVTSGNKADASDNKLKEMMSRLEDPSVVKERVVVVVISGDRDFAPDLQRLRRHGFKTALFAGANAVSAFQYCVDQCFSWDHALQLATAKKDAPVILPEPSMPSIPPELRARQVFEMELSQAYMLYVQNFMKSLEEEMSIKFDLQMYYGDDRIVFLRKSLMHPMLLPDKIEAARQRMYQAMKELDTRTVWTNADPKRSQFVVGFQKVLFYHVNCIRMQCRGLPPSWSEANLLQYIWENHRFEPEMLRMQGNTATFALPPMPMHKAVAKVKKQDKLAMKDVKNIRFTIDGSLGSANGDEKSHFLVVYKKGDESCVDLVLEHMQGVEPVFKEWTTSDISRLNWLDKSKDYLILKAEVLRVKMRMSPIKETKDTPCNTRTFTLKGSHDNVQCVIEYLKHTLDSIVCAKLVKQVDKDIPEQVITSAVDQTRRILGILFSNDTYVRKKIKATPHGHHELTIHIASLDKDRINDWKAALDRLLSLHISHPIHLPAAAIKRITDDKSNFVVTHSLADVIVFPDSVRLIGPQDSIAATTRWLKLDAQGNAPTFSLIQGSDQVLACMARIPENHHLFCVDVPNANMILPFTVPNRPRVFAQLVSDVSKSDYLPHQVRNIVTPQFDRLRRNVFTLFDLSNLGLEQHRLRALTDSFHQVRPLVAKHGSTLLMGGRTVDVVQSTYSTFYTIGKKLSVATSVCNWEETQACSIVNLTYEQDAWSSYISRRFGAAFVEESKKKLRSLPSGAGGVVAFGVGAPLGVVEELGYVIQTLIPKASTTDYGDDSILSQAIKKALGEAAALGCKSVAIPGGFGDITKKAEFANLLVTALQQWTESIGSSSLQSVVLYDRDSATVTVLNAALHESKTYGNMHICESFPVQVLGLEAKLSQAIDEVSNFLERSRIVVDIKMALLNEDFVRKLENAMKKTSFGVIVGVDYEAKTVEVETFSSFCGMAARIIIKELESKMAQA